MKQFLRRALLALILLNVLDLSLTYIGLHIDGMHEKNPINALFLSFDPIGYILCFIKDIIIFYVLLCYLPKRFIKNDERTKDFCILGMTIIFFVIQVIAIVNNIYLIGLILSR